MISTGILNVIDGEKILNSNFHYDLIMAARNIAYESDSLFKAFAEITSRVCMYVISCIGLWFNVSRTISPAHKNTISWKVNFIVFNSM